MGEILNFLDTILDIGDLHARYGIKGCLLILLVVALIIGAVIILALALG